MCELFAMSSSLPEDVSFSLDVFSKHGGLTDLHKDGWGIAYYDLNDVRIIKEACSASKSAYLNFVKDLSIRSNIIISHIRLATQGEVSTRNTQPFARELGGKQHVFAHNGDLHELNKKLAFKSHCFRPIGNTDSELAFCYLLEAMKTLWDQDSPPSLNSRYEVFFKFASKMKTLGIANIIYSDSEYVFIHSDKRLSPDGDILAGLYMTRRRCSVDERKTSIEGLTMGQSNSKDVVLVASVPLSDEEWQKIPEGEICVLKDGKEVTVS